MPLVTYVGNVGCGSCERTFVVAAPNQPTLVDAQKTMIASAVLLCNQQCDPDVRATPTPQLAQFRVEKIEVTTAPLVTTCRQGCHNQIEHPPGTIFVHANGDTPYPCTAARIAINSTYQHLQPQRFSLNEQMTAANIKSHLAATFETARLGHCAQAETLFTVVERLQTIVK